jgi:uncharacterized protein YbaR (Trm112 family)
MIGALVRLILRIFVAGALIGAATAALGLGATAVSELLSRRGSRSEEEFDALFVEENVALPAQELDDDFLSLLACPQCKTSVRKDGQSLVCDRCALRFPIRDGIPVMLIEEAEPLGGSTSSQEAPKG